MTERLVQYIVVRSDLRNSLKWPVGALIAQACHASTSVIKLFYEDLNTKNYLLDLNNMHKIVLEIQDQKTLEDLSSVLTQNNIDHKLWVEQPENIPTCLALKPYPKEEVQKHFKKLKLFQ
ncbi:hypothetical protein HELRODRAFT_73817 [Helobdella robusta]|uniref:peptidyl-tRNA hydrolase n=1 Tax=Helobdella robusta TaxID=6412 RepID=T1G1I6_HELRO|nr:hypothetical protein HELRODRAFT_73817 [Helobdella robusta]ESO09213.1 hypothetical protein HELRODRAFT_73817 [Helobdella robusta]